MRVYSQPLVSPTLRDGTQPITVEADEIETQLNGEARAKGHVMLKQGDLSLRADNLSYVQAQDRLHATGNVQIDRAGDRFWGPELTLNVQQYSGEFLLPHYWLARTGAGGQAHRAEFIDKSRSKLFRATYTSCPSDGSADPDWLLSADRVYLDIDHNEGIAEGAVLRFLGVPILGLPRMSFPITSDRKSGWLPPNVSLDSRSGFELSVPYYWNIAPNYDAMITPIVSSRRGVGFGTELRYLRPSDEGVLSTQLLPNDRVDNRTRYALDLQHRGSLDLRTTYAANIQHVSDDNYWKDFSRTLPSLTQRLLPQDAGILRRYDHEDRQVDVYARVQTWQVLQAPDPDGIAPPYQRAPQLGLRIKGSFATDWHYNAETELNRFTVPEADPLPTGLTRGRTGTRWHLLADMERRFGNSGWWITPRAAVNVASYETDLPMDDGRRHAARAIPSFSVDGGMLFERDTRLFGREVRQTLEPRLLYARTPYRDQSSYPNFDSAAKDFNFVSIYSDNVFSGVDWVSDADQITAGVTTRFLDARSGAELLRLGVAQRYVFGDQRLNPDCAPDVLGTDRCAQRQEQLSDLLLLGSSRLWPAWVLDGTLEFNPSTDRSVRAVLSGRYNPQPYHTVSLTYRLARGLSEQFELGWQWPIYRGEGRSGSASSTPTAPGAPGAPCQGALYGVGRVNYSTLDRRITDSIVGVEYDAGCWIGRVFAERLSVGRSEATTRLLIQLELVGLSRLGSNPLATLMENVPGYRLLREESTPGAPAPTSVPPSAPGAAPVLPTQ